MTMRDCYMILSDARTTFARYTNAVIAMEGEGKDEALAALEVVNEAIYKAMLEVANNYDTIADFADKGEVA